LLVNAAAIDAEQSVYGIASAWICRLSNRLSPQSTGGDTHCWAPRTASGHQDGDQGAPTCCAACPAPTILRCRCSP